MTTSDVDVSSAQRVAQVRSGRSLTPDLARGLGMAGVVLVNASMVTVVPVRSTLDAIAEFVVTLLLEGRSWPMFALMFGWGLAASAASLERRGLTRPLVLRTLRRRGGWLIVFGLVQSVLYFSLDILGIYGLTAVVLAGMVFWSSRARWTLVALALVPWPFFTAIGEVWLDDGGDTGWEATTYLLSVAERLAIFLGGMSAATLALAVVPPMVVGLELHRRGALRRPEDHLALHRRLVAWGLPLGLLGGLPWALVDAGWWGAGQGWSAVALFVHLETGVLQGVAYVSLLALWQVRAAERPGRAGRALAAVGQRSLTVYLVHALLLSLTLSPWALDVTSSLSLAGTYAWATAVWLLCATLALALHAAGRSGPAETALRHVVARKLD